MKLLTIGMSTMLGLLAWMPDMANAQTAQDTVELNLDKVLEIALSDNPDIKVADKTIEIQKYAKKESITGLFPTITASASGTKNIIIQSIAMMGQVFKMGTDYSYSLSGTAALPLVVPQLWKTISLNEEQVQLAVEQARESKVNTIAQVKNAYYSLLLARDSYDALMASYRTAERNANDTKHKYEVGSVSEYDKLQADVQFASIKPNVLAAQNGIRLAEMNLKVLMGVDVAEPIRFVGKLSDYEEELFGDLLKLKSDTGLDDNSTLRQLDYNERILRLSEKINKLGYLPTLALAFTSGYSGMGDEFSPFKTSYYPYANLSLSLSWTLFDGMSKYMKTKQNKLSLENLEIQRENVARQLELSVTSSLNNIETAAEQVVSNKENVYSAERAYNISEKRYSVGSGTMLEVTSSESSLLSARLQYVQSIYDFLSNRATLEQTLGKLVTDK